MSVDGNGGGVIGTTGDASANNGLSLSAYRGSGYFSFRTGGSDSSDEKVRLDSSGRLLVGTSTSTGVGAGAGSLQQIFSNSQSEFASFHLGFATPGSASPVISLSRSRSTTYGNYSSVGSGDSLGRIKFVGDDGTDYVSTAAQIEAVVDGTPGANDMPGRLVFSTTADGASSPTERLSITNAGLTRLVTSNHCLEITSAASAGTTFYLIDGRSGGTIGSVGSGSTTFRVYTNGNAVNTNNSYGAISDIKLKENIVDARSQWDDIKDIRVRNYNFIEGQTHTQIGVVAQEVETVSPGLVTESPDRDEDGNDLGTVTKSVNYSVLYMKAVKALQEAMERIETLEAKVAALEAS
jgi:hypothetical protein